MFLYLISYPVAKWYAIVYDFTFSKVSYFVLCILLLAYILLIVASKLMHVLFMITTTKYPF